MESLRLQQFVYGRVLDYGVRDGRFGICASSMSEEIPLGPLRRSTYIGSYFTEKRDFSAYAFATSRVHNEQWVVLSYYRSMDEKMQRGGQFLVPVHSVTLRLKEFLHINCDIRFLLSNCNLPDFPRYYQEVEEIPCLAVCRRGRKCR